MGDDMPNSTTLRKKIVFIVFAKDLDERYITKHCEDVQADRCVQISLAKPRWRSYWCGQGFCREAVLREECNVRELNKVG